MKAADILEVINGVAQDLGLQRTESCTTRDHEALQQLLLRWL